MKTKINNTSARYMSEISLVASLQTNMDRKAQVL